MEVLFKMEGGIAYFPGLSKPVVIKSDDLDQQESAELEQRVAAAHFFELPLASRTVAKAADYHQYTISITTTTQRRTVRLSDPIQNTDVQALVDCLKQLAQAQREHH